MSNLESFGEVYAADVLIIGAGPAGFIAANRIKELNPDLDVLMIEKSTAAVSGAKANKGAGVLWVLSENDDLDKFRDFFCTTTGHFIEDQELLEKFALVSRDMVNHLERWNIKICREPDGTLARAQGLPLWSLCAFDLDILTKLKKIANKRGVRVVNKTQTVELLTDGGRVVGTVGFDLITGEFRIFKGKSVILANGACDWMVANMWTSARGDGIAAAYRAGAEMRNAEFSNFYNLGLRGSQSCPVGGQFALYNSDGEYLAPKYCSESEHDIDIGIILGMEKEVAEGRGPIVMEETELFANNPLGVGGFLFRWDRPNAKKFWTTLMDKEMAYSSDKGWRPEVFPMFIGECAPVKTDHGMAATLQGLWAIGDTNRSGAGAFGAVPAPSRLRGTGLTWAAVSALLSEKSVVEFTKQASEPEISEEQVKNFKDLIYAPMKREKGLSPRGPIFLLGEAVAPPRFSARKSKERLEEALAMVNKAKQQYEDVSPANDFHMLGLCHDLRNMADCAEMYLTAALDRTESRGWHYREDFPARDDANWRKWIDLKLENGKIVIGHTEIPHGNYKTPIQPTLPEQERILQNIKMDPVLEEV